MKIQTLAPALLPRALTVLLLPLFLSLSLPPKAARGEEEESLLSLQRRFESYKRERARFQESPFSQLLVEELSQLIRWISEADIAFSEEDEELCLRLVNRLQVQVRLIKTTIDERRARAAVERIRQEAVQLESRARAIRSEVAALEQRIGGAMRGSTPAGGQRPPAGGAAPSRRGGGAPPAQGGSPAAPAQPIAPQPQPAAAPGAY